MALFTKRRPDDPIASLEARLTAERAKRDNIAERLRVAEVGAAERRAAAEALAAAGGSDRELDGIDLRGSRTDPVVGGVHGRFRYRRT